MSQLGYKLPYTIGDRISAKVGVSRTHQQMKEVRCCTRDEGRSLGVDSQVLASNHCKLLS